MSAEEILAKAIEKAIAGGWNTPGDAEYVLSKYAWQEVVYEADFAKALWGEEKQPYQILTEEIEPFGVEHETYYRPKWQVHLQQMVIAEDTIAYLAEHM